MIGTGLPALRECPGTVVTVSVISHLVRHPRTLGHTYPDSYMRYECNLKKLWSVEAQ